MEKKTQTSKNTFEVPVTENWDAAYQTNKQQAKKKMQTHLSKTLRLFGLLVPCVEVFYVMDKSAAAQCSINIDTYLFRC